jgi:hypothetical protein
MNQLMVPWKSISASLQIGVLTEGWKLAEAPESGAEDSRYFTVPIHFSEPFSAPPVVHLGLTGFDIDQRDSERLSLRAVDISNTGFVAEISTWRDTRVYSVEFSWLALGA